MTKPSKPVAKLKTAHTFSPSAVRQPKAWSMKYQWIPAALDSFPRGITLGVRFKPPSKTRSDCFEVKRVKNCTMVNMPDRILYVMRAYTPSDDKHFPHEVDQVMSLDLNTDFDVLSNHGMHFGMINSSALPKKYRAIDYDKERSELNILADSGGFQLNSGAKEFLDPVEIIETHNTTCDIGIALDVPLPQFLHRHFLKRAAHMQRNTLELFLKHKRKSLDLMNVFHGGTVAWRRRYREVVELDGINRTAIGGGLTMNLHPLVMHVMSVIQTGRVYDQYHILGVSSLEKVVVLAYIANRTRAPLITSDSSSYIQVGVNNGYWLPYRPTTVLKVGTSGVLAHPHTPLPCSCSSCSMVRYLKVLTLQDCGSMHFLSVWHNLHVNRTVSETANDLALLSHKEILEYVKFISNNNDATVKSVRTALMMVDFILDHSVEAAEKRWPSMTAHQDITPNSLFSGVSTSDQDGKHKRFDSILKSYEKYFK